MVLTPRELLQSLHELVKAFLAHLGTYKVGITKFVEKWN